MMKTAASLLQLTYTLEKKRKRERDELEVEERRGGYFGIFCCKGQSEIEANRKFLFSAFFRERERRTFLHSITLEPDGAGAKMDNYDEIRILDCDSVVAVTDADSWPSRNLSVPNIPAFIQKPLEQQQRRTSSHMCLGKNLKREIRNAYSDWTITYIKQRDTGNIVRNRKEILKYRMAWAPELKRRKLYMGVAYEKGGFTFRPCSPLPRVSIQIRRRRGFLASVCEQMRFFLFSDSCNSPRYTKVVSC